METIGEQIRAYRAANNLSAVGLARRISGEKWGKVRNYIWPWEHDKWKPRGEYLKRLIELGAVKAQVPAGVAA